jgi:NitT/TauT family transport system substrate-binding protein
MNEMFWRTARALAVGLLLISAPWAGSAESQEGRRTKSTFMFPVQSVTQYHPHYIADRMGYFSDEGLDVEFQVIDGSSAAIRQLISGNADAAQVSAGAFLNAVANDQDLKWVFTYQYTNVFALAVPTTSEIASVADLKGKKVGISGLAGGEVPLVRAVLRNAGLEEGVDVQLVPVGAGSALTVNALMTGQVDAYSSDVFDIAAIEAAGIELKIILPDEARNFPTDGVVVRAESLADEEKRRIIVRVLRGIAKGIVFAEANDRAAFEIAAEIAPEEFEENAFAEQAWRAAKMLKTPPPGLADQRIGTHFDHGFRAYHDFLLQGSEEEGALPRAVDLNLVLDSSLLDAVNDFDRQEIERQAGEY